MNSTVSLGSAVVGGIIAFTLGVAYRATWQAFKDLRDNKAKTKALRRGAWGWLWSLTKHAAVVLAILAILVVWVWRDRNDDGPTPLAPTRNVSPSPRR